MSSCAGDGCTHSSHMKEALEDQRSRVLHADKVTLKVNGQEVEATSAEIKLSDDVARNKRMEDMPPREQLACMMALMNRKQARAYKARMKHFHSGTADGPALLKGALEQAQYCLQQIR